MYAHKRKIIDSQDQDSSKRIKLELKQAVPASLMAQFCLRWGSEYTLPTKFTSTAEPFTLASMSQQMERRILSVNHNLRSDRWTPLDHVREKLQNFSDACKRTAQNHGCEFRALHVECQYDKDARRTIYCITALLPKTSTSNGKDEKNEDKAKDKPREKWSKKERKARSLLVGVVVIEPYLKDIGSAEDTVARINISTYNPGQVMGRECLNMGKSTKSDDGITSAHVEAMFMDSGFYGDGMKAGIAAHIRMADIDGRQPQYTIYSDNKRLEFGIAGHKTHSISQLAATLQFEKQDEDCILYLCSPHHTGSIVKILTEDIESTAFSQRAFCFLCNPHATLCILPSIIEARYNADGELVGELGSGLKNTRAVARSRIDEKKMQEEGQKEQKEVRIANGGWIHIFKNDCAWEMYNDMTGKPIDRLIKNDGAVLYPVNDSTFVRGLMLCPPETLEIYPFPGEGVASAAFSKPFSQVSIFDAINLCRNPAGVERQLDTITEAHISKDLFYRLPHIPLQKQKDAFGERLVAELATVKKSKAAKEDYVRSRYTSCLIAGATQSQTRRWVYEQLFHWILAVDQVNSIRNRKELKTASSSSTASMMPQMVSDLHEDVIKWLSLREARMNDWEPVEISAIRSMVATQCLALAHQKRNAYGRVPHILLSFCRMFRDYAQNKLKLKGRLPYAVPIDCTMSDQTEYITYAPNTLPVGCGKLMLYILQLEHDVSGSGFVQRYEDLELLRRRALLGITPYSLAEEKPQMRFIRERLDDLFGNNIQHLKFYDPAHGNVQFATVVAQTASVYISTRMLDVAMLHHYFSTADGGNSSFKCVKSEDGKSCLCQLTFIYNKIRAAGIQFKENFIASFDVMWKAKGKINEKGEAKVKAKMTKEAKEQAKIIKKAAAEAMSKKAQKELAALAEKKKLQDDKLKLETDLEKKKALLEKEEKDRLDKKKQELKRVTKAKEKSKKNEKTSKKQEQKTDASEYLEPVAVALGLHDFRVTAKMEQGGPFIRDSHARACVAIPRLDPHFHLASANVIALSSEQGKLRFNAKHVDLIDEKGGARTDFTSWKSCIIPSDWKEMPRARDDYMTHAVVQHFTSDSAQVINAYYFLPISGFGFTLMSFQIQVDGNAVNDDNIVAARFISNGLAELDIASANTRTVLMICFDHVAIPNPKSTITILYQLAVPKSYFDDISPRVWCSHLGDLSSSLPRSQDLQFLGETVCKLESSLLAGLELIENPRKRADSIKNWMLGDVVTLFRKGFSLDEAECLVDGNSDTKALILAMAEFLSKKTGVCRHKAMMAALIMQSAGMEVYVAQSPTHVWTIIWLPGEGAWKRIDMGGGGKILPAKKSQGKAKAGSASPASMIDNLLSIATSLESFSKSRPTLAQTARSKKQAAVPIAPLAIPANYQHVLANYPDVIEYIVRKTLQSAHVIG